jgi:glycosyltransferase involved in cell wall biosynthesis
MTPTEAAACGTPAVVTDIAGHRDAVADGCSGLLVPEASGASGLAEHLHRVVADPALRARLSAGALAHAAQFTWQATALGTLQNLATEAVRRDNARPPGRIARTRR